MSQDTVIPYSRQEDDNDKKTRLTGSYSMPKKFQQELELEAESDSYKDELTKKIEQRSIKSKENDYQQEKYRLLQERLGDSKMTETYSEAMNRREKYIENDSSQRDANDDIENKLIASSNSNYHRRDRTPPRKDTRKRKLEDASASENESEERIEIDSKSQSRLKKYSKYPVINGISLKSEILDRLLPKNAIKVPFPKNYKPLNDELPDFSKFNSNSNINGYMIPQESTLPLEFKKFDPSMIHQIPDLRDLQYFKESDMKVFGKLIQFKETNISTLSKDEQLELRCMKLILKIKNGSPVSRKLSMRNLTDHAKLFGPDIIFNIILPLMKDKSLEEQERHLLVKVIGRVLFKLDDSIRPYTHKILIVIMPLLIDENLFTRLEGREIISNLAKAAGLAHMISTLRPDIDNSDEYVRNLVSRTFAVITNSLGIQSMLPFLKAVCNSKKSWLAKHTGIKIIQNISILMGSSILPYLNGLVNCISKSITDENLNVRTITALTISSLAEASYPYGFESFQVLLDPLSKGLNKHRGKNLAAFLRALGNLIPLMDEEYSNFYTSEILKIIIREVSSPEDEMKKTILIIIEKICSLETIDRNLILKSDLLKKFFKSFWSRRIALDKKISILCVDACYALSLKVGTFLIIENILSSLKDESEPFRRMSVETCDKIVTELGSFDLDDRSVNRLLDGLLFCFQNQEFDNKFENMIILNGFGNIMNNLGIRVKPNIMKIISAILYRLKNKDSEVREQAADLISKMVSVLKICQEDDLLIRLGTILYESLGEVYPDVLGSILNSLRLVIDSIRSIELLNPPISQILSTLTPILRNRHEKVQETTINLIGDIADRAKDYINHREWMRISFELLEMLKSHKKSIRMSANKTFGLIAKAIGPSDVLVTLLNNLKVQERQLRVCTAVAIGIVAKICLPFTVLPALMNEYRYPDKNVQNGVLKAMSFMFEYLGDLGSDYVYATTPLLLDALTDRDLVHRQIASSVVKHMAIGSYGLGYEDAFINFLDLIWPNVFETSPHVIQQVLECIESLRLVLGDGIIMNYLLAGLFHPARKVRHGYWKVYNNMYVNSAHAMIPFYPRFEAIGEEANGEEENKLKDLGVGELDIWI